jgi:hypothetical protein
MSHAARWIAGASLLTLVACESTEALVTRRVASSDWAGGDSHEVCVRQRRFVDAASCPSADDAQRALVAAGLLGDKDALTGNATARERRICCYAHDMEETETWLR